MQFWRTVSSSFIHFETNLEKNFLISQAFGRKKF